MRCKQFKEGDRVRLTPTARRRNPACAGAGEIDAIFESPAAIRLPDAPPGPMAFVGFDNDEAGLFRWDELKHA